MARKKAVKPRTGAGAKKKTIAKASKRSSPSAIFKHYTSGATLEDLKKKFGIRGRSQVASAVLATLIAKGKMPPLESRSRKKAAKPKEVTVSVNKRGTIILPKDAVVGAFGAKTGETYTVRKRGGKIILTLKK